MELQRSWKKDILPYLTQKLRRALEPIDPDAPLEEIRIRTGRPLQLCFSGYERLIGAPGGREMCDAEDMRQIVSMLCDRSVYAWEEEIRNGFVTLPHGCRAGVCGRCVVEDGRLHHISDVTSVNIRIARAVRGAADAVLHRLTDGTGRIRPTLLLSEPGCGKTTLLRDLARQCADGAASLRPARVSVVDTRFELSGAVRGVPQFDLGARTDVRSGGSRAEGIRQMVLCMSPEVLVTDEISSQEDAYAILDAAGAGVTVLASAHAAGAASLRLRPMLYPLIGERVFERYVVLGRSRGTGTVERVLDADGRRLAEGEAVWQKQLRS